MQEKQRVVITLPTYNESGNILPLIHKLRQLYPAFMILVIDDDSPDKTWQIVQEEMKQDSKLFLLHRCHEKGRGTAGRDGFLKALELQADYVVEMDADFSHNPIYIQNFLDAADQETVVIGSRLVKEGAETGRFFLRKWITFLANAYIRILLGIPVRDCTSGFRLFPKNLLENCGLENLRCTGPEIVQEMLFRCRKAGGNFLEVPILFEERYAGESTFNWKIMVRSLLFMISLRFSEKK